MEIHNLFDKVTESEADLGKTEFRCVYIKNKHTREPIRNPILIIVQNTASSDDQIAIGWGTGPFGGVEQTIATESTPPTNVSFKEAPTRTEGAVLGVNIPPSSHKAFWIRRVVSFDAQDHPQNGAVIRLLSDNVVDEVINEEQIPEPDADTSFSAVGEFDDSFTMEEIYARIRRRNSNMHISTGNLTPPATATATAGNASASAGGGKAVATAGGVTAVAGDGVMNRTRMSFGKNDYDNKGKENAYKNKYGIANRYSSYQFQNVHFLFMDTAEKKNWDQASPQFAFVKKDLTDAAANPANDWIFVVMNRVMYASATTTEQKFILKELRDLYHPVFQEKGVHIVLQGDLKNYQRSYPLAFNAANSDVPILIDNVDDPEYTITLGDVSIQNDTDVVGTIFLVDGTGSGTHHNISPQSFFTIGKNASVAGYMEFFLKNTKEYRKITGVFYAMAEEEYYVGKTKKKKYKPDKLDDKFTVTKFLEP